MIPARFDYVRATSASHALDLVHHHGEDAKFLAGGHSLLPLMKYRLAAPTVLVDVGRLPELRILEADGDWLRLGAGLRYRELLAAPVVRTEAPLLAAAIAHVGDPQVRARGTIGGAVVHGDPAADVPAVLLALEATFVLRGRDGDREVAAADFFVDFWETAAAPGELLVECRVRRLPGRRWGYRTFRQRSQDWSTVGVAAQESVDGSFAVGLVNMGPVPMRAAATEAALSAGEGVNAAAARAAEGTAPPSDLRGDADYRRHLARVLASDALVDAGAG